MGNLIEDIVGTTTSTLTPIGCVRNCTYVISSLFVLYIILVIIFIFVQGGIQP
jgi:hypothetical protein